MRCLNLRKMRYIFKRKNQNTCLFLFLRDLEVTDEGIQIGK